MKIPFFKSYWRSEDVQGVKSIIQRGMHWANGPEVLKFEKKIARLARMKYGVAFNSGTSALQVALLALEIGKGDEVIVPSFTFIATANVVKMAGAKPVFADIEAETFGLETEDVKKKVTKRTKAIMPIHYGGCVCRDIRKIKRIARENKLLLIEDAAQSLGAKANKRMAGAFGEAAMFSFTPTKVISTGEGGVTVTNSKPVYEKMKLLRSHGRVETADYFSSTEYMDYVRLGFNFRMPTICAALGLAQLEKLKYIVKSRRRIAEYYSKQLDGLKEIKIPKTPKNFDHVFQIYAILVKKGRKTRDRLQKYLEKSGITAKVYFEPVHKTGYYSKVLKYKPKLPVTEKVAGMTLSLPIYPDLKKQEQDFIIKTIKQFFNK